MLPGWQPTPLQPPNPRHAHLLIHRVKGLQLLQLPPQCVVQTLHQLLPLLPASALTAAGSSCEHLLQQLLQLLPTLHGVLAQLAQLRIDSLIAAGA